MNFETISIINCPFCQTPVQKSNKISDKLCFHCVRDSHTFLMNEDGVALVTKQFKLLHHAYTHDKLKFDTTIRQLQPNNAYEILYGKTTTTQLPPSELLTLLNRIIDLKAFS